MYYLSDTAPNGVRTVCNWDAATNTSSEIFSFSIVGANGLPVRVWAICE